MNQHLDGIKGSFYIIEGEYLAPAIFHEKGKVAFQRFIPMSES
jgi:hypothetical protein